MTRSRIDEVGRGAVGCKTDEGCTMCAIVYGDVALKIGFRCSLKYISSISDASLADKIPRRYGSNGSKQG
jgi:hypothetical protein